MVIDTFCQALQLEDYISHQLAIISLQLAVISWQ